MSRLTRILAMVAGSLALFAVFAVAGWAATDWLASSDDGTAELTEIPILPAQSVEPLPDMISILVSPDGDRPEIADDESTWVFYGPEGDITDSLADPPTTDESSFGDPRRPYRDDAPRTARFPADAFPPEPDDSESTGGTVPIPEEPGPIGPSVEIGEEPGTPVPLIEDFDPRGFPTPVPRLVDPCTTGSEYLEDCVPGIAGTIVPLSSHPDELRIFDITSDVGGRCDGQFSEVPRDSFGIAIFSNRPGDFDVTSQPTRPGAPRDEASVSTPASQIDRWSADESVTVTTCVALDRAFSVGSTVEESRYRVRVIGLDPLADPPPMVERFVTVSPTGRPEVVITPTGDRSFAVSVPARSDEQVIVALLPRVGSVDDVCDTIDVPRWEWPDGAVGLEPLGRVRVFLGILQPLGPPFTYVDPGFDTRHYFEATVDSDAPLALCVLWFAEFVPSPVVTERQSYAIDPPTRPHVAISIFAISDSGGDEEDVLVPESRASVGWRVHDAWGEYRCGFGITNASDLPSGPCEFDILQGGGVFAITLTGHFRRSADGSLATSSADAEVSVYDAPPVVRAINIDSYGCEPTCRVATPVTINGPNERGRQYVLGTAQILIEITNWGDYRSDWRIRPTGPFTAEGEPAPDHVQLNFASSAVTLDPQWPAAVLRVKWETDRPALVSASWGAPHAPLSNRTPPRHSTLFPPQPVSCGGAPPGGVNPGSGRLQTEGQMILPVRCPATPFEVTLRVEGEDGTVVEYGEEPSLGGISYPWDGGSIRTEPLPVLVEWEVRHRRTRAPERMDLIAADSGPGLWDIATHLQLGPGYEYEERHSSWLHRAACGDYDDYDTASDGPIRFEVGPEFQIILWTETWRWSGCDLVGGAVGEAVRGSPVDNIYRNSFIRENWTFVSVLDVLRENQPLVFVTSIEDCLRGCLDWLTSELVVTIRLENELYRQPDILGG